MEAAVAIFVALLTIAGAYLAATASHRAWLRTERVKAYAELLAVVDEGMVEISRSEVAAKYDVSAPTRTFDELLELGTNAVRLVGPVLLVGPKSIDEAAVRLGHCTLQALSVPEGERDAERQNVNHARSAFVKEARKGLHSGRPGRGL